MIKLGFVLVIQILTWVSFCWAQYEFTAYEFSRNPARADNQMRITMNGRAALRSYRFVGRVGGVNFETSVDLSGYSIDLDYSASQPDGARASMRINGQRYTIPLYDWQLRPIVEYANSPYTAVVSIFGEGPDPENYYYIDYHPAFEDTHLGARLLQADIILMDPIGFSEVPSAPDGQPRYYAGESRQASEESRFAGALSIANAMSVADYQAWVLTDTDLVPSLAMNGSTVSVSLSPYYYFWNSDAGGVGDQIDLYNDLVSQASQLSDRYDAAYQSYLRAPVGTSEEANAERLLLSLQAQLEPLAKRLDSLQRTIEEFEPSVVPVTELTSAVIAERDNLDSMVPFVYEAVDNTARYSALFRGAKARNPADWQQFRQDVTSSVRLPRTITPNQFRRR